MPDQRFETVDLLKTLCTVRGAKLTQKGHGHFHIEGQLLVNYYPFSSRRTAYVAGTTVGRSATPEEAVNMAFTAPPRAAVKDDRSKKSRKIRKAMLGNRTLAHCHWCKCEITLDTSTIEHIIPLYRGGLDNSNNRTLACEPCNTARANNMPELERIDETSTFTIFGRVVDEAEFRAHKLPDVSNAPGPPWKERR